MSYITIPRPCGDFRRSYAEDMTVFPTRNSRIACLIGIGLLLLAPAVADLYALTLLLQIGYYAIAAIGLNILVGIVRTDFAWPCGAVWVWAHSLRRGLTTRPAFPVFFAIPLAGLMTTAVGMIFGMPAARLKGLYLAIATLAAEFILEDFFVRAEWFSGGAYGASAEAAVIFGFSLNTDARYYYLVLGWFLTLALAAVNLRRSRDGRALVAIRDHYLSAEMMGINLTKYRLNGIRHFVLLRRNCRRPLRALFGLCVRRRLHHPSFHSILGNDNYRRIGDCDGRNYGRRLYHIAAGSDGNISAFAFRI